MLRISDDWIARLRLARSWWVEHGVDVANLLVTIVLAFLIHALDSHERRQDDVLQQQFQQQQQASLRQLDDDQRLGIRQNAAENDFHQAFVLYTELISTGNDDGRKRALTLAVKNYSSQNRLYQPATNLFSELLGTECDQLSFERLRDALDFANKVPRKDAITDYDLRQDSEIRAKAGTALQTTVADRSRNCNLAVESSTAKPKSLEVPVGYFDVGCNEANRQDRAVPLSDDLKKIYRIASARAYFTSTSNVESSNASAIVQGDSVLVRSFLQGMPKEGPFQLNCPGGGHGTLVVHMELVPR